MIRALIAAGLMAIAATPSFASLIAAQSVPCGDLAYVSGLNGRTGLWIDSVGPVCSRWDTRTLQAVPGQARRVVGGNGGGANRQACSAGSAVSGWQVRSVIKGTDAFVDGISVQCRTLAPPHTETAAPEPYGGKNRLPRAKGRPRAGSCPAGELATSLSVWTTLDGRYVTDVDMHCARAPWLSSDMAVQRGPNGSINYFAPELKLASGDSLRLDWCLEWADKCGKPAADAFCASKRMGPSIDSVPKRNVGLTVIISDRRICNSPACTGFERISCGPPP